METISMSQRERHRLEAFARVGRGEITLVKAAELLGLSYRQAKRCFGRYQAEGDRGLVHRLRGRSSNRQVDAKWKHRVLAVYEKKYPDYGPTLAAECMQEDDGPEVAVEKLRQWLLSAGLWRKQRRSRPYRQRRPRREYFGEMVQMDGSHHDWFEGRRGKAVLMVMIDDATSEVFAWFSEQETTIAAMEVFRGYVERYGVPRALYVDRDSIYRPDREATLAENLAGKEPTTQFGRAMEELDVKLILAHSPQAKGRVERVNGTLQDRLVKALRREDPNIVLLSPGPDSPIYFEQALLSRYLGYPLVEGQDLTVRNGRVYLKKLAGLEPVDTIFRHISDQQSDPFAPAPGNLRRRGRLDPGGARAEHRHRQPHWRRFCRNPGVAGVSARSLPLAHGRGLAAGKPSGLVVRACGGRAARQGPA